MSDTVAVYPFHEVDRYRDLKLHFGLEGDERAACGCRAVPVKDKWFHTFTREYLLAYEPLEGDCKTCIRKIQRRLRKTTGADAPKGSETDG